MATFTDWNLKPTISQREFFAKRGWIIGKHTRLTAYTTIKNFFLNRKQDKELKKMKNADHTGKS